PERDGCWEWTGDRNEDGDGVFMVSKEIGLILAHRFSFMLEKGFIPEEVLLDQLCRNRACVRPSHLVEVTAQLNTTSEQSSAPQGDEQDDWHGRGDADEEEGERVHLRDDPPEEVLREWPTRW